MKKALFWSLLGSVAYTYVGYGVVISALARLRPRPIQRDAHPRRVTLLIAAYNEETVIDAKLRDTMALDYPREALQIIVVTDGSTDRTVDLVRAYEDAGVICLHDPARRGKMSAIRRALAAADGEILVFSDANAFYNREALRHLIAPFADPQVGCVTGEKRVTAGDDAPSGEGLYWRYESYLKHQDSMVHSAVGAVGELYAVRRELLVLPPDGALLDDFMVSMYVARQGYRVVYEPRAQASEEEAPGLADEFGRRVRIGCGGFQSIWWLRDLLHPRYGLLWFQYLSHRVLRWAVAPLALPALIVINCFLLRERFYRWLFGGQALFYLAAGAGLAAAARGRRIKPLFIPGYFVMMNAAALAGLYRYLTRTQPVTWAKASRSGKRPHTGPPGGTSQMANFS